MNVQLFIWITVEMAATKAQKIDFRAIILHIMMILSQQGKLKKKKKSKLHSTFQIFQKGITSSLSIRKNWGLILARFPPNSTFFDQGVRTGRTGFWRMGEFFGLAGNSNWKIILNCDSELKLGKKCNLARRFSI